MKCTCFPSKNYISKLIGVGSGGGDHATLAKRDTERCMACHDVNGADPTCITCHFDADGIKGTNPKTHPASFMRNDHGDWHNDLILFALTVIQLLHHYLNLEWVSVATVMEQSK